MNRKLLSLFLICILLFCFVGAGYPEQNTSDMVSVTTEDISLSSVQQKNSNTDIRPYDMEVKQVGDISVLLYYYELSPDIDVEAALPDTADMAGVSYKRSSIFEKELAPVIETKTVYEEVIINSDTNDSKKIAETLSPVINYNKDGFTGTLSLELSGISSEEAVRSSYSYPVTESKEYSNLDRADVSYIPKTIQGSYGQTLQLKDVDWVQLGGNEQSSIFSAQATYAGTAAGSRVTGYSVTARYSGEVKKETAGNNQYTVLFEEIVIPEKTTPAWVYFLIGSFILIVIAAVVFIVYYMTTKKSRTRRRIWNV